MYSGGSAVLYLSHPKNSNVMYWSYHDDDDDRLMMILTSFAVRSCSVAAPILWNLLSPSVKSADTIVSELNFLHQHTLPRMIQCCTVPLIYFSSLVLYKFVFGFIL